MFLISWLNTKKRIFTVIANEQFFFRGYLTFIGANIEYTTLTVTSLEAVVASYK